MAGLSIGGKSLVKVCVQRHLLGQAKRLLMGHFLKNIGYYVLRHAVRIAGLNIMRHPVVVGLVRQPVGEGFVGNPASLMSEAGRPLFRALIDVARVLDPA